MSSTITWGNLMALLLPGLVLILSAGALETRLGVLLSFPNAITASTGTLLLMLAVLMGGIVDGLRRITTEKTLGKLPEDIYAALTPDNLKVWESGVENSYRYYTFYANLALVGFLGFVIRMIAWFLGRLPEGLGLADGMLLIGGGVMEYASRVQYSYFDGFCRGFVKSEETRRSTAKS